MSNCAKQPINAAARKRGPNNILEVMTMVIEKSKKSVKKSPLTVGAV